jgi:hypothetical protein
VEPYGPYLWEVNDTVSSPTSSQYTWVAGGSGNSSITGFVADGIGDVSPASNTIVERVPFPIWVGRITAYDQPSVDVGQAITFVSHAGGGVAWLGYAWSGLPTGCTSSNVSRLACTPSAPGNSSVYLLVHDALGDQQESAALHFDVSSDTVVHLSSSHAFGDLNQSVTFTARATGGAGGYQFVWHNLLPDCAIANATVGCTVTVEGLYVVSVAVTDTNQFTAQSVPLDFAAYPPPSVNISATRHAVDLGANVSLTAVVGGGAGNDSFTWLGLPAGCASRDRPSLTCTPISTGVSEVTVGVIDRSEGSAGSPPFVLAVVADPTLALAAQQSPAVPGNVTFLATLSGGTPPILKEGWHGLPAGCPNPSGLSETCVGIAPGNYTISLTVFDSGGGNASARLVLLVGAPPSSGGNSSSPGMLSEDEIGLIAVLVVVGVAIAIAAARPRSGGGMPPPPDDQLEPDYK